MEFKLILILILILQVTRSIWLEGGEPPKCKGGREWDLVSDETGTAGAFSFALSPLGGGVSSPSPLLFRRELQSTS